MMSATTPSDVACYVRADLAGFGGYSSAAATAPAVPASIWLNANESPWPSDADPAGALRRYPAPQPAELVEGVARLAGVATDRVRVGRGSDEIIDLLVRLTCRPGQDAILLSTPTFGMYEVAARLHGTRVVDVPLRDDPVVRTWTYPTESVVAALAEPGVRLVFLCSPGNPTGQPVPLAAVGEVARAAQGRALVVVDEAYLEFSGGESAVTLQAEFENIVVLRTLSKAYALAGARLGYAIAALGLIDALGLVQAPYPLPEPVTAVALEALRPEAVRAARERASQAVAERERMIQALANEPCVAYPSSANFVLLRVSDPDAVLRALADRGVVVRDARSHAALPDGVRISVGTPEQTDLVLDTLRKVLR